jgi:hypothetical protein
MIRPVNGVRCAGFRPLPGHSEEPAGAGASIAAATRGVETIPAAGRPSGFWRGYNIGEQL